MPRAYPSQQQALAVVAMVVLAVGVQGGAHMFLMMLRSSGLVTNLIQTAADAIDVLRWSDLDALVLGE